MTFRRTLKLKALIFLALIAAVGVASAGTYTIHYMNVRSFNDTLNLAFASTVANATVKVSPILDNNGGGVWKYDDKFPLTAATTTTAQYCIKIRGNWVNVTNSTGYIKASFYDANFWTYVNSTGTDIRIANQSSQLYFWIEDFNATAETADIWVNLTAGSTELNLIYGNPSALPSSYNNASKTFVFYNAGDNSTWINVGTTEDTADGNPPPCLKATGGTYAYINAHLDTTKDYVIKYDVNVIPGTDDLCNLYFFVNSTGYGQMFRTEARATYFSGFAPTTSYTLWSSPVGTTLPPVSAGVWLTVQIVTHGTYATATVSGLAGVANASIVKAGPYIAVHGDASVVTGGLFDNIMIMYAADPATFGTPAQYTGYIPAAITVNGDTYTITSPTTSLLSTDFASTTTISFSSPLYCNVTLSFDYLISENVTVFDYGNFYEKNMSVDTTGLTTNLTLNVSAPLRTLDYYSNISVTPSASYTLINDTNASLIYTSFDLANNTTYNLDLKFGYLIANFTGKDELSGSSLSSIFVNFTGINGYTSKSGSTVKIYGNEVAHGQSELTVEFSAASYSKRHYIVDLTKLNQSITIYLLADSSSTMITYTITTGSTTLSGAKVVITKLIGDKTVIIDSQYSDASGVVAVPLHAFDTYTITASKPGYATVTATITITQSQYTIKLGGVSLAIPASHRAVIVFKPAQTTLQVGNNTIAIDIVPQGTTVNSATMTVYVNNTPVATVTKTDISTPTTISVPVTLNQSSSVSVKVTYTADGKSYTVAKNYTVPVVTGMWAALLLLNNQLAQVQGGSWIGILIAAFIALAVVASLAALTPMPSRGLGLIGIVVFTIVALPIHAVPIGMLIVVWVSVFAAWILWKYI